MSQNFQLESNIPYLSGLVNNAPILCKRSHHTSKPLLRSHAWLLFVSGVDGNNNHYVVFRDGACLLKLCVSGNDPIDITKPTTKSHTRDFLVITDFVNAQHFCHPLIFELSMFLPDTMSSKWVNLIFFF